MTWLRRLALALGGFWVLTAVLPGWFIGGFLIMVIPGVLVDSSRPTPWGAVAFFVLLDLGWLAVTVLVAVQVARRWRARSARSASDRNS